MLVIAIPLPHPNVYMSEFGEPEQESNINPKTMHTAKVKTHKRVKRTRDEIMADLLVEEVFHEVEGKVCDLCGYEVTGCHHAGSATTLRCSIIVN